MAEFTHKVDFSSLSPESKLQILKEMGFGEVTPREHAYGCTSLQGSGLRCTCMPPLTTWTAPGDVRRYMGETKAARQEFAEKRWAYLNDGIGDSPGSWVYHLEQTAPRYQD